MRLTVLALLLLLPSVGKAGVDFVRDIQPILESSCVRCHGAAKESGGFRMHDLEHFAKGGDGGVAVVAGKPVESELIKRLEMDPGSEEFMPQKADALTGDQIKLLSQWIAEGAVWPAEVKLKARKSDEQLKKTQQLLTGPPPASLEAAAKRLDELITLENAHRDGLIVTGEIDDLAFLRRVTLDLIGRIPTPGEVEAYQKLSSPTRRAEWVKRLLQEERFADRWAVFFSDLLRVRTELAGGPQLQAFIHQALRDGMPYDELASRLISAQGRPAQDPAVGWILGDQAQPFELAGAASQIFLGVRMSCAECHDHPFDDWNQRDFYDLASFFGKTQRVQNDFARTTFTTEAKENAVLWPPERLKPDKRAAIAPRFPFEMEAPDTVPSHIVRYEAAKAKRTAGSKKSEDDSIDALLDVDTSAAAKAKSTAPDVTADAKVVDETGIAASELRQKLAAQIASPRNAYFARAFANRMWAELVGHGFVEPLDNFSEYNQASHPATVLFLAQEFVASGYDVRALIEIITLTKTYQRGHLGEDVAPAVRAESERNFTAAPTRAMLSEALFDSVVIAGHLTEAKWPAGANLRTVQRQIRVPVGGGEMKEMESPAASPSMMTMKAGGAGYDLEKSIAVDFKDVLKQSTEEELRAMKEMEDARIEQQKMMAQKRADAAAQERYEIKTVEEKIDDNPSYSSTMKMASPAEPDHFLRVFGQPSRQRLGEFRDPNPSLRQQLMMLNGHATHHASRVGPGEPVAELLAANKVGEAVDLAYLEILTRLPSQTEKEEAGEILSGAASPAEGMADLRWALLNSHEFRYLP